MSNDLHIPDADPWTTFVAGFDAYRAEFYWGCCACEQERSGFPSLATARSAAQAHRCGGA